jgi:hypothetical protein
MPSFPIERASTPHRRGISEITPRPEHEEEDRLTQPIQKPDLAVETGTQGTDVAAADAVAVVEALALALAETEIETGPTQRSKRQQKAPARQYGWRLTTGLTTAMTSRIR